MSLQVLTVANVQITVYGQNQVLMLRIGLMVRVVAP